MLCKPKYPFNPHTEIFDDHLFQLVAKNGIIRKEVSRVFQGSFKDVSRKFQGCFKEVSRLFQGIFKGVFRVN